MPTKHVIRDDDGEYFSEDPTFGIDSAQDSAASAKWAPIKPYDPKDEAQAQLKELVFSRLTAK